MKTQSMVRRIIQSGALVGAVMLLAAPAYAAEKASGPNDAEIAHIVVTANAIDVEAGELAKKKAKSEEVKKFAERMITDHNAVNKQAGELAKKLGVTPQDNATSKSLKSGAEANIAKLKTLKGSEFDKEYVTHEVAYHQAVLDAIDKVLIPNAQNAELKALIEQVRPAIAAHLDHSKQIESSLAGVSKASHKH